MKNRDYISLFSAILVLFLALLLTVQIVRVYHFPLGSDYLYHRQAARLYLNGRFAMFDQMTIEQTGAPYPPLFHLLLAFFMLIGLGDTFPLFLQIIGYPLLLLSAAFLVFKFRNCVSSTFTLLLMFSSMAVLDRSQVIPQTVELILYPLAVLFYLKRENRNLVIISLAMVYTHAPFTFFLLIPFIIHSILFRRNLKPLLLVLVLSTPFVIIYPYYVIRDISRFTGHTEIESQFLQSPMNAVLYLSPIIVFLAFSSFLISISERQKLDDFDWVVLLWTVSLLPLLFVWADRFLCYAALPLSIYAGSSLSKITSKNHALQVTLYIVLFAAGFFFNYARWWIHLGLT